MIRPGAAALLGFGGSVVVVLLPGGSGISAQSQCTFVLRPASVVLAPEHHFGRIDVLTQPNCLWQPSAISFGLKVQGTPSRQAGPGTISYILDNMVWTEYGVPHTLTLRVESATFTAHVRPKLNGAWFDAGGPRLDAAQRNPDLLWQHQVDGRAAVWLMDRHVLYDGVLLPGVPGPDWLLATGIESPTSRSSRIVWQHRLTGELASWEMTGLRYLTIPYHDDPDWRIRSMTDFDLDSSPDLILQHSVTGALAVRRLGGNGFTLDPLWPPIEPDLQWVIAGSSDFNNDGWSDLVWQHRGDGRLRVWLMYGASRVEERPLGPGVVADTDWRIGAVVDLDSDNSPDLVWQHGVQGWLAIWYMNGLIVREGRPLSPNLITDLDWQLAGPR